MRVHLTRRQALWALVFSTASGALTLSGCGGGGNGGGGPSIALAETRGRALVPAGFPLPTGELTVSTAWGQGATLTPDLTFSAKGLEGESPTLAWLRHGPSGRPVLFGFVGDGQSGVGAKGTAVMLLSLFFGGGALPGAARREMLALIEQHPAAAELATVVERRVVANPFALVEGDTEIGAALGTALVALNGGSTSRATAPGARTRAEELEPTLTLTPEGPQSLAQVVKGAVGLSVQAVNRGRRPCAAYTYRIGQRDERGVRTDLPRAVLVGQPQDILAVASLPTALVTLGERPPWVPKMAPAVELTAAAGATETYYETVILLPSMAPLDEGEPGFFREARYQAEVETWRAKRRELNENAWIGGILFDLLGTLIGGTFAGVSTALLTSMKAQILALEQGVAQAEIGSMLTAAAEGRMGYATLNMMKAVTSGNGYVSQQARQTLIRFVEQATLRGGQAVGIAELSLGAALTELALVFVAVAGTLGAVAVLADFGVTVSDLATSNKAERWLATVVKPTLRLEPADTTIPAGATVVFTANVSGETGRTFRYRWRLEGGNGVLSEDGAVNVGREIETTGNRVTLQTAPSDLGTLTVRVQAGTTDENGAEVSAGAAAGTVRVDDRQRLVYGRYVSRAYADRGYARGYVVIPRVPGAASYSVYCHGFDDPAYFARFGNEIRFSYPEPPGLQENQDSWDNGNFQTASEIWHGLSAGGGSDLGSVVSWLDARFAGMIVEVTVTLR